MAETATTVGEPVTDYGNLSVGLADKARWAVGRFEQNSCDELEAGYRTLTGIAPLQGSREKCDP